MIDPKEFRELTKRVIAAEKQGFWSDWTEEQRNLYVSGDWKAFSRSRGYTEDEINECASWLEWIEKGKEIGLDLLADVKDLTSAAALKNMDSDNSHEIMKSTGIDLANYEKCITDLEKKMSKVPGAMKADDLPLKHTFMKDQYMRESFIPKGTLFTTQIHKTQHPFFIIKGDVTIISNKGSVRIKAPYHAVTEPGTKRVIFTHEDSICVTVHATDKKDVKSVEAELVSKTYKELKQSQRGEPLCLS